MATNLSSKNIIQWQNGVNNIIGKNLANKLKNVYNYASQLSSITKGNDENDLSYRFNDLAKVSSQASQKLNNFLAQFNNELTLYINTTRKAEVVASDAAKVKIDQFAEAADKIANLKI